MSQPLKQDYGLNGNSTLRVDPEFYRVVAETELPKGLFGGLKLTPPSEIIAGLSSSDSYGWRGCLVEFFTHAALHFRAPFGGLSRDTYGPEGTGWKQFRVQCGDLSETHKYIAIVYPKLPLPAVDPIREPDAMKAGYGPLMSIIAYAKRDMHIRYFVLWPRIMPASTNPHPSTIREYGANGHAMLGGTDCLDLEDTLEVVKRVVQSTGFGNQGVLCPLDKNLQDDILTPLRTNPCPTSPSSPTGSGCMLTLLTCFGCSIGALTAICVLSIASR